MISVRLDTFGLNTLRVCRCENETLCPYILPFPVISQVAILFLLHRINDLFKRFWIIYCEVGQNLAIQRNTFLLHARNELRIRKSKFSRSVIDARNPERPQIAFLVSAISVAIRKSLNYALFAESITSSAVMLHTFCSGQHFFVLCVCCYTSFNSHTKLLKPA